MRLNMATGDFFENIVSFEDNRQDRSTLQWILAAALTYTQNTDYT